MLLKYFKTIFTFELLYIINNEVQFLKNTLKSLLFFITISFTFANLKS